MEGAVDVAGRGRKKLPARGGLVRQGTSLLASLDKFLAQGVVRPVIEHGVRQEEQEETYFQGECL
ncbi:hypothetical protein D3C76_1200550 [compost metagenome]